ncbi:Ff.00g085780.m01.CDS01 [Fusarium sp. VM40]|nr:Ff.00g085780.m01.CDS01 [Fusarium sp. VM40]
MTFPKHLPLASRACELPECPTTEKDSIRCTGCMVVRYCSAAHQALDRNRHEKGCKIVKNTRRILDMEQEILRDDLVDASTSESIFGDDVGYLWTDYMNARYDMVHSLLDEFEAPGGNVEAVNEALDSLLDMLHSPRRQYMVVQDIVPHLYLRLNRDQEAYDFLKWYATTVTESDYNWEDILPDLDVKDADVLEKPLDVWSNRKSFTLDHVVAATLIKVRILLDLQAAQKLFRILKGTMPPEIIEMIRGQFIGSVLQSRPEILRQTTEEISTLIQMMKGQIIKLYKSVHTCNTHFWRLILNNETTPVRLRGQYSIGTENHAYQTLNYCWSSWVETQGALGLMKDLSEKV